MSKRLWLLGLVGLITAGLLVACGSKYNSSSNGLVLVGSQGSSVIQTYSFDLNSGHVSSIGNSTTDTGNQTCILNGSPASMVVQPDGAFAYVIFNTSSQCPNATQPGIATFQVKSDGTVAQVGNLITLNPGAGAPVNPTALSVDAAGKFLFVANRQTSSTPSQPVPDVPGSISVLAIGSGGNLAEVSGSPFFAPVTVQAPNIADITSVAATPTVFPGVGLNGTQNAVCSAPGTNPPTSQFLYAVDSVNYMVWEFSVDMTTGALGNPPGQTMVPGFPTDAVPAGVAVDPCDRFVYVSGSLHNKISAYTICTQAVSGGPCLAADGKLVEVSGSPFSMAGSVSGAGPIVVDPYGNYVFAVGSFSNTLSGFKISSVSGSITALSPATVATGLQPKSIVFRGDDNWIFVTNYGSNTMSQYSMTPASGALSVLPTIQTDNYPFGVAVK
jgi:6-phosphogluconolactonase (cycloisomerase 2 family)